MSKDNNSSTSRKTRSAGPLSDAELHAGDILTEGKRGATTGKRMATSEEGEPKTLDRLLTNVNVPQVKDLDTLSSFIRNNLTQEGDEFLNTGITGLSSYRLNIAAVPILPLYNQVGYIALSPKKSQPVLDVDKWIRSQPSLLKWTALDVYEALVILQAHEKKGWVIEGKITPSALQEIIVSFEAAEQQEARQRRIQANKEEAEKDKRAQEQAERDKKAQEHRNKKAQEQAANPSAPDPTVAHQNNPHHPVS